MSEAHVEIVQRIYRAWGNGEQAEARELLHADIESVNPPHAIEPGTRKGIDAFVEALEMVADTFDGPKLESEEFREVGGHVVVIGVLHGRGQSSGIAVERRQGYVWTIRDGKAVRFAWFNDPTAALEAAGAGPGGG